ncbi:class I SAM-dependent methyltransferase [Allopusillimonas ginsengisoli]|uniref:class I SAM-dependent methyltransferase n=1 Tax=Allopusillimonas ginsengisoli TaxID=453575 RepID=UPI0039C17EC8
MTLSSQIPEGLPRLGADAAQHCLAVCRMLKERIHASDGFLPFEQWMGLALYAPGLGYYVAGSTKLGSHSPEGDFTTAPEMTPLFGQTLARQAAQILQASASTKVLEFGAGTGALAASLIPALQQLGIEPDYQILELSPDLRARQQATLAGVSTSVTWLDELPQSFSGCVLANEVLDAMPTTLFKWDDDGSLMEVGVRMAQATPAAPAADTDEIPVFELALRKASPALNQLVGERMPALPGYLSEINLQAEAWVRELGSWLKQGAALLIDYGFPQREYYHPQRAEGTLMCHFRHHTHGQPLIYPGLQDITAHVDFTAMADAALAGGLDVLGYTSQARFLMNAGMIDLLTPPEGQGADTLAQARDLSAVQKLLSEAEMGELFKVLAISKQIDGPLLGFMRGDRRDRL